jgi:hypothetical protein
LKRLRVQLGVEHAHVETRRRRNVGDDDIEVIDLGRVDREQALLRALCVDGSKHWKRRGRPQARDERPS